MDNVAPRDFSPVYTQPVSISHLSFHDGKLKIYFQRLFVPMLRADVRLLLQKVR